MAAKQPNILLIMPDQLTPFALGAYGHPTVKSPNIDKLADEGVVFDSAYCNSPLCAPSRFSMMSGRLPSAIGAYDNASYFPSNLPNIAHYLRAGGYHTCLTGKMHFVGPDQLHGFEDRRTTDIYPGDFGWVANWDAPDERIDWWYHNMDSVKQAGVAEATNQLDFDDDVGFQAVRKLRELARADGGRPFFLTVAFTHPHDPYVTRQKYWDLYDEGDIPEPTVPAIPFADMDPHSQRVARAVELDKTDISSQDILNARRAYLGNVSYIDDWVGELMQTLKTCQMDQDTIVIFAGDHGDMLGERGLWYKMTFFEGSARVPLIFHAPEQFKPGRIAAPVSLVDILPTLNAICDCAVDDDHLVADGRDLSPYLNGSDDEGEVIGEYMGEGAAAPVVMIRRGDWKYIECDLDPPQLFNLKDDPNEMNNLAGTQENLEVELAFASEAAERWNLSDLKDKVIADQHQRRFIDSALRQGTFECWDYQPVTDASSQYMRNHLDLNDVEGSRRFPRFTTKATDKN